MSQITLEMNGRSYTIACDDGEEEHLTELAEYLSKHVTELAESIGQVGDTRLILMAGLVLADELAESLSRIDELEVSIARLKQTHNAQADGTEAAGEVLAELLDKATQRVEEIAVRFENA